MDNPEATTERVIRHRSGWVIGGRFGRDEPEVWPITAAEAAPELRSHRVIFWNDPEVTKRGRAMDSGEREAQVRRFIDEVWNGQNYAAAADLYGEAYSNALGSGPSARGEAVRRYHGAFPDLHLDVDELIVAGDTVVLRATFRGTDTGGYAGRPSTGRAVEEWGITIMHFEHDRVVREWIGADKLGLFIQLGVVENPWPS